LIDYSVVLVLSVIVCGGLSSPLKKPVQVFKDEGGIKLPDKAEKLEYSLAMGALDR